MFNVLLYIWQLPQNIVALFMLLYFTDKEKVETINNIKIYSSTKMRGGISLGNYIIVANYYKNNYKVYSHEYGHAKQSKMLGCLYLIIIGVFSLIHAAAYKGSDYYSYWTEKWANKLVGIYDVNFDFDYKTHFENLKN